MRTHDDELRAQIQQALEMGNADEADRLRAELEHPEPDEMVEPPEDEMPDEEPEEHDGAAEEGAGAEHEHEEPHEHEELLYENHELPPEPQVGPSDDEPERPAPPDHE
jgi:hypothetical protein